MGQGSSSAPKIPVNKVALSPREPDARNTRQVCYDLDAHILFSLAETGLKGITLEHLFHVFQQGFGTAR